MKQSDIILNVLDASNNVIKTFVVKCYIWRFEALKMNEYAIKTSFLRPAMEAINDACKLYYHQSSNGTNVQITIDFGK